MTTRDTTLEALEALEAGDTMTIRTRLLRDVTVTRLRMARPSARGALYEVRFAGGSGQGPYTLPEFARYYL